MTPLEWEQLCMKCGRCCLRKFMREEEVVYTRIACFKLNMKTKRCLSYAVRDIYVANCKRFGQNEVPDWLPTTCAYVRFIKGLPFATPEEIEEEYPWNRVISERDLPLFYKAEDYEL